ncbi:MAG: 30S ribosome-binding factor RbfA [Polyangiaceae bacterium]|nr:30S ribosome-binding factor RbfA [Polyangiaceae bacterium]
MSGAVKRSSRVSERLREELSALLRGLNDPRVVGALVTRVEMPDDLQSAKVFVRRELGPGDEKDRRDLIKGLQAASGKLRREAGQALGLRYSPELRFFYDDAQEAVTRVEELLQEIKRDESGKPS